MNIDRLFFIKHNKVKGFYYFLSTSIYCLKILVYSNKTIIKL
jgi:hypothetical protein